MDQTGQANHDLPTASLSREPLSYSSQITSDMPWVLRFVGCFIILQSLTPLLDLLTRLLRFEFGPVSGDN